MPQPHKAFSPKLIMNSSNIELFSNLASMEGFNSSILPLSHEGLSDHHHHQTHFLNMDFHDKFPRLMPINAPTYNPMGHLFPSSHEHHNSMETVALQPHLLMNSSSVTAKPNRKNPIQSYDGEKKRKRDGKKEQDEVREVVHVRAKRGQATDSHSLAERLRREKINEKLRCLQDLVPGCYKTMGMAVMLDVIINYVQSLQSQIDFLSMKLSAASLFDDFISSEAEEAGIQTIQGTTAQWIMEKQKLVGESYGGISQFQTAANWPLHFSTNNNTPM